MSVSIEGGGYAATVLTAGGGLGSLTVRGVPLVAGPTPGEVVSGGRGQVLLPWPNRLRDGSYSFNGSTQQLALSEPARHNASHGLVRWCTWRVVSSSASAVELGYVLCAQKGYPWSLDLTATYEVSRTGLTVTLSATNLSASPAPFAAGMHPYLTVGAPLDECTLTLPAATRLDVDDRLLPTGSSPLAPVTRLAGITLDAAVTDLTRLTDGRAVVRLESAERAAELWVDEAWPWLQVYSGDDLPAGEARQSLAVEPMTAPPDAFNSGTDLVVLAPGGSWTGTFGIRAG